jgi:predicted N-formylglutamate amidohydrolase
MGGPAGAGIGLALGGLMPASEMGMAELLAPDEPPAADVREDGAGPFVVVCEHASNRLPRALGTLGLQPSHLRRHIAWDPGAAEIATRLATSLPAALVLQRYSRLAIDCNRRPELADAIATRSEDTAIPGNLNLNDDARSARISAIWAPFHAALEALLDRRCAAGRPTALVTVHTFTPVWRGIPRPWHAGLVSTDDRRLAEPMLAALRAEPGLVVGDNQPYSPADNVDYTIRRHGLERGLAHVMIEVRNDLVASSEGQREWAMRLAGVLEAPACRRVAAESPAAPGSHLERPFGARMLDAASGSPR